MPHNKVNVLFITRRFPPSVGGMEKFASELHEALSRQANTRLIKWGGSNKYLPIVLPYFFIKACWILLTTPIDVIHTQDGLLSPMGLVLKFLFRKPLLVVIHGLDITFNNKLYQNIVPKALKSADSIICISQAAKEEVIKRGVPSQKVTFIPIGVEDNLFLDDRQKEREQILSRLNIENKNVKIVLSTGRLVKRKGVNWFIKEVMPGLTQKDSDVILVVSGDGEDREEIEKTIIKLKLASKVYLLGRTSNEFLSTLYNGSDIFVMPNIKVKGDMEGFGLVLLEASLCELPIVASGIEGIVDAVKDRENAVLVKPKDKNAYVKNISMFLNNKTLSNNFGKKSRKYTQEHYNWNIIAHSYVEIYQKLTRS